uniref:Uncharacterized protein n=1 Tax=Romanomermis culicivorax TaxID=13658 RepID=A0A915KE67_ROMCU
MKEFQAPIGPKKFGYLCPKECPKIFQATMHFLCVVLLHMCILETDFRYYLGGLLTHFKYMQQHSITFEMKALGMGIIILVQVNGREEVTLIYFTRRRSGEDMVQLIVIFGKIRETHSQSIAYDLENKEIASFGLNAETAKLNTENVVTCSYLYNKEEEQIIVDDEAIKKTIEAKESMLNEHLSCIYELTGRNVNDAMKKVKEIDHIVHLSLEEYDYEFVRQIFHAGTDAYIQHLMDEKQANEYTVSNLSQYKMVFAILKWDKSISFIDDNEIDLSKMQTFKQRSRAMPEIGNNSRLILGGDHDDYFKLITSEMTGSLDGVHGYDTLDLNMTKKIVTRKTLVQLTIFQKYIDDETEQNH